DPRPALRPGRAAVDALPDALVLGTGPERLAGRIGRYDLHPRGRKALADLRGSLAAAGDLVNVAVEADDRGVAREDERREEAVRAAPGLELGLQLCPASAAVGAEEDVEGVARIERLRVRGVEGERLDVGHAAQAAARLGPVLGAVGRLENALVGSGVERVRGGIEHQAVDAAV